MEDDVAIDLAKARICIHNAQLVDKYDRKMNFALTCEGDAPVVGGGHGEGDGLSSCEHGCCKKVLPRFPSLSSTLSAKLPFDASFENCEDALDALGIPKDPCAYDMQSSSAVQETVFFNTKLEDLSDARTMVERVAHEFCRCFMECAAGENTPAPVPGPPELLVKNAEQDSHCPMQSGKSWARKQTNGIPKRIARKYFKYADDGLRDVDMPLRVDTYRLCDSKCPVQKQIKVSWVLLVYFLLSMLRASLQVGDTVQFRFDAWTMRAQGFDAYNHEKGEPLRQIGKSVKYVACFQRHAPIYTSKSLQYTE
jgi:hypothetical protein